jgi:hypothetical protein
MKPNNMQSDQIENEIKQGIENKLKYWIPKAIKYAVMGAVYVAVSGYIVMFLWNWLAPPIFHAGEVTWLQALGLFALAKVLFGGRGWGWGCGGGRHRSGRWQAKWEQKWEKMTPEQREQMKAKWGKHCNPRWAESHTGDKHAGNNAAPKAETQVPPSPREPFSPPADQPAL